MCAECRWSIWLDRIDDMLLDETYIFADDTLSGIKEWIDTNQHITDKQREALINIYRGGQHE